MKLTIDLFGENIIDGDDSSSVSDNSNRKERLSAELGTVVISKDGDVENFLHGGDEPASQGAFSNTLDREQFASAVIWRKAMIPYIINNTNQLHKNVLKGSKAGPLLSNDVSVPNKTQ